MATIGRNISFPIKNADGSSFHGLVLRKATVDSVVMSLGDKITGYAYYKNNHLECTMQEYVEYNDVKYTLVNPPTIVREGLVSDNSDLKGMTKYSFEFYHPMCILANLPFSDVAVSNDEKRYLSENKTFSWVGKPQDFINKINKNLEGTEWIVVKSDRFPDEKDDELSEVLTFDNSTIADALKTGYETWGLPYVVSQIQQWEEHYSDGKRFKVEYGLPSNEIVVNNETFVFQFGKGVGLKNNSRTPRNNKIITRIAGYGSEKNIPYGYPQIRWYGNPSWKYTINSNSADPNSYPIYMGIVGGAYVPLIKHPFTRTHLMPSVYSESVFNKVSPYLSDGSSNPNYDPDIELVDYYDAVSTQDWQYVNEINLLAPSYESHEFDIKPEMDDGQSNVSILGATPLNNDLTPASGWDDSIDDDGNYVQSYFQLTLPQLSFDLYACAAITEEMQVNMRGGACLGCTFTVQVDWEDYKSNFYDSDGNFLPNGEQRDLTKYPKSNLGSINIVVQKDTNTFGTLMPNRYQYPKSGDDFVVLGISLPQEYIANAEQRLDDEMKSYMLENNVSYYDYPLKFDEAFLYNHSDILEQIRPNTIIRFGFGGNVEPLELFVKQLTVKYGEGVLPKYDITLTDNIEIVLNQLGQVADSVEKLGALVATLRQTYNRNIWSELEKKLSKAKDDNTPYKLGMRELDVNENANIHGDANIGKNFTTGGDATVKGDLLLNGAASRIAGGRSDGEIPDYSGIVEAFINFLHSDNYTGDGAFDTGWMMTNHDMGGNSYLVVDNLFVRMKALFTELEIRKVSYAGGNIIFSHAGSQIVEVRPIFAYDPTGESVKGVVSGQSMTLSSDSENESDLMNVGETTTTTVSEPYIVRHYEYDEETGEETVTEETRYNVIDVVNTPLNIGGDTSVVNSILSFSAEAEAYRCYIKKDDGTTSTENWWRVDDQARCQTFNIEEGTHYNVANTFYWRRVVGVGSEIIYKGEDDTEGETFDYIDLSATDCITGSTIPAAGDNVVQMGNRTDAGRQGFIAMEVTGENAPAIKIYRNVNSYSLEGKMPIILSPYKTEIRARRFITETDYDVQPVPLFRGAWSDITDSRCYYYDEVTHNGSSWICTYPESGIGGVMYTTEEPSITATYWQIRAVAGESIQKLSETYRYALSDDGTTPSGSWVDNKPTVPRGKWLLIETTITWSSGQPTVLVSAERNPNDGIAGQTVHVGTQVMKYAVTDNGTNHPAENSDSWADNYTPVNGKWLWTKITTPYTYTDGTSAGSTVTYQVSYISKDGESIEGRGISSITEYYKLHTASTGVNNEQAHGDSDTQWSTTVKTATEALPYLWNYELISYTDSTSSKTPATVIGNFSADGKGIDQITNYYKASSNQSELRPQTDGTNGWTTSIQTITEDAIYLWNYEKVEYTEGQPTYTDPHIIGHWGRDGLTTAQLILNPAVVHVPCYADGTLIENFYAEVSMRMHVNGTQIALSEKTVTEEYTNKYVTEEPNAEMMIWEDGASVSGTTLALTNGASVSGSLLTLNGSYYPSFNKLYVNITGGTVDERTVDVSVVGHDEDGNAYYCYATLGIQRQYIVRDAINIPEYHQQRYAWSAAVSTQDQTTQPDDISETDWSSSTPAQVTGKPYLWLEDTLMVWNEENYGYDADTPIYTRLSGENGTGVAIKGSIPSTTSTPEAWLVANVSNPDSGDSYIYQLNGHLYVYNGSAWQDVGQIKGDNGTSQYVHIAWADVLDRGYYPSSDHFFISKSYNEYYPYMGVYVDANAGQDSSNARLYTWSEAKGDANVIADIDNEMDSVPCTYDGNVETETRLSTNVSIWYGTEALPPSSITVTGFPSGTYASALTDDEGAYTGEVQFHCTQGAALAKVTELTITISAYRNGTLHAKNLTFTVNGIRAAQNGTSPSLYRLVPSTTQVVKTKSGSYSPSENISCTVTKNVGGTQSTPAASEYSLMMKVNGENEEAYEPVPPSSVTSGIEYILRVGGTVVDRETIRLVADGNDGDDAVVVTLNRTAVIFTQSLTSEQITYTPTSEAVVVSVTKGATPITSGITVAVTGTSHINNSSSGSSRGYSISGRTVTLYASGINTYQEDNTNYPYESGYVDIRVTYDGKNYDHRINFYVNALGKFKSTVVGDVEETIASKTYYVYDKDGHVTKSQTIGDFIRSSSQNTSKLTEEVEDETGGLMTRTSAIEQSLGSISLKVSESVASNMMSDPIFMNTIGYTDIGTSASGISGGILQTATNYLSPWQSDGGQVVGIYIEGNSSTTTSSVYATPQSGDRIKLTAGVTYTFSVWYRVQGDYSDAEAVCLTANSNIGEISLWTAQTGGTRTITQFTKSNVTGVTGEWKQASYTFTPTGSNLWFNWIPFFNVAAGKSSFIVLWAGVKLEASSEASIMSYDYTGAIRQGLVETGIDIENRKITFTADTIKINNNAGIETAGFDKNGNFSIAGIINSKIITITTSNAINYGSYSNGILRLNPLLITDVMITEVNSIYLPIAYSSTASSTAEIYAWDSTGVLTMNDIRRCVGKKIYVLPSSLTAQLMFIAGETANTVPPLLVRKTEYMGDFRDLQDMSSGSTRDLRTQLEVGKQFGGSGVAGYFHILECKMGIYNQHECIYWELQTMAQVLT